MLKAVGGCEIVHKTIQANGGAANHRVSLTVERVACQICAIGYVRALGAKVPSFNLWRYVIAPLTVSCQAGCCVGHFRASFKLHFHQTSFNLTTNNQSSPRIPPKNVTSPPAYPTGDGNPQTRTDVSSAANCKPPSNSTAQFHDSTYHANCQFKFYFW